MNRLTTSKPVNEMNMLELAYNSCYAKDGHARYRDFENDYDARDLCRSLLKNFLNDDAPKDNEEFDDYMLDLMQYGYDITSIVGLITVFYRNLWTMADLRERLKEHEDLEEQGLLMRLPCKKYSYLFAPIRNDISLFQVLGFEYTGYDVFVKWKLCKGITGPFRIDGIYAEEIGKTVFLTKEEAEAKLKEMEVEV